MLENLKITTDSKRGLEWLKEAYSFTTYSIAIDAVVQFFKHNKINPRDSISENYSQVLFDFKKEMFFKFEEVIKYGNTNTERIIKIDRRIEEDLLKPINKKLIDIHKISLDSYNKNSNVDLIKNVVNSENENLNTEAKNTKIDDLNKIINEQDISIKEHTNIVKKQDEKLKEYHRCLKKLNENMRVERGITGNKVFINLPVEEAEALFHLIP